ncbi:hypothetical protein PoB_006088100 [Plakobranchus ocellatus]|uniref:Uncharacterized protein n=1 Tax=Plakobranchus ocellatus TaxID=259542 RepID=A0AAV4CR53_9GAST|nr:hypothetical protein PoB_006088100 [Plakobranchus ocellatus]
MERQIDRNGDKRQFPERSKNKNACDIKNIVNLGVNHALMYWDSVTLISAAGLRLSGPPSGQARQGSSPRQKFPADLRADSLATVSPTPENY